MSKFKVKITRTEVYEREVEVEAEDARAAEEKARENEQDNEYAALFDCPDVVQTTFRDANGENDGRIADIAPFSTMTVTAKVDWDFDDDVRNSGLAPEEYGLPSKEQKLVFTADELKVNGVVDCGGTVWALDEGKLEEYVSDKLTDETGFCHNGFTFDYKINKGE